MIEFENGRLKEPTLRVELIAEIVRLNEVVNKIVAITANTVVAANVKGVIADSEEESNKSRLKDSFDLTYDL